MSSAEDTVARWRAEEDTVRTRLGEPGYARPAQVRGHTGLEARPAVVSEPASEILDAYGLVSISRKPRKVCLMETIRIDSTGFASRTDLWQCTASRI